MGNAFYIDGDATKLFESVPIVGYVTSAVHAIAGNHKHAKRAAAKCTNATVTTICAVGGGMMGGVVGGAIAGAAGSALGIASEQGIAVHIHDPAVRAQLLGNVER